MGKIKFAHDSDTPCLSKGRLALAIITFPFVVYLIPGSKGSSIPPAYAYAGLYSLNS